MEVMTRIPAGEGPEWTAGRHCGPPQSCRATIRRMLDAATAMQRQAERMPPLPRRSGRAGRRIPLKGICLLFGLLVSLACLLLEAPWAAPSAAATSAASSRASYGSVSRAPWRLREQSVSGRPAAESLASNIRGYYARVPGGFEDAVQAAREAAADRPLEMFPPLPFDALDRAVPVVHAPPDLPPDGRIGGYFSAEKQHAFIAAGFSPAKVQVIVEHELTHAWQFAPREQANLACATPAATGRYQRPLGKADPHREILDCMFSVSGVVSDVRAAFVRDYLCRPSEIDVRLAAFKRWWAWNHGQLLAIPEQVRQALEHPRSGDLEAWPDVNDAVRIWDSYRNQPEVQEMLLTRMQQVL